MTNSLYDVIDDDVCAELLELVKARNLSELQNLIQDPLDRFDGYYESQLYQTPEGNLAFELIHEEGGGEGGGDYVERVYKVSLADTELFTFRETGYYDSYNGTEWNNQFTFVVPVQKMITVYEDVK